MSKNKILFFSVIMFMTYPAFSQQTCEYQGIPQATPNEDFKSNGDGTVTHLKTGLMWKVCSEGQSFSNNTCTGTATKHKWKSALERATESNKIKFAGHKDWRLPNINELLSLGSNNCTHPAINLKVFPNTPYDKGEEHMYWSSTPVFLDLGPNGIKHEAMAMSFNFTPGYPRRKARQFYNEYVRLVRTAKAQ